MTNQKAENELKLIFQTSAQMLEFERQSKLSVDTMPGTKILIQNPKFVESYIAINNSVRVLGHGSKYFSVENETFSYHVKKIPRIPL